MLKGERMSELNGFYGRDERDEKNGRDVYE
jgi:hypothetical protein